MNRQRLTRSLRINLLSISLFLFGRFLGFGPGAAWTQYLTPDALLLSAFAESLYHWHTHTHTQHTLALATASPTTFCLRSISGPRTTHTGACRHQPHYVLPLLSHCIIGPPTLSLSLGTTTVQKSCKSAALRVPALQGVTNLLQYIQCVFSKKNYYLQIAQEILFQ